MSDGESFYVTTPIYYVNDIPHLGTAYCTFAADVLARYERLRGKKVLFLTGTDEHGEKIQEAAAKKNKDPQAFTDEVSAVFHDTWKKLNVSFDDFIRTTEKRHADVVAHFIKQSIAKGDIYLGEYEGWYCVPDESFWTEAQLVNGKCPTCGRDVKKIKEENYFFKLSKYVPQLKKHIEDHPDFILPEAKRNEVLGFLKEDIRDISMSRTSFTWGIKFPAAETAQKHVIYVWFDALINYVSALNPLAPPDAKGAQKNLFAQFWGTEKEPRAIHLVGKDILRFHAVYWPCLLMSVGLPLPKRVFAHGWWTIEGQKMSKSLGNAVDPIAFTDQYGIDAFRLFLFREFPMGQDGDFSLKNFKERVNADLANNFGNLVSRTLNLVAKNLDAKIFQAPIDNSGDEEIKTLVTTPFESLKNAYLGQGEAPKNLMETFGFHVMLQSIFTMLNGINKYLEVKAPWTMAKDPSKKDDLVRVLNNSAEVIRLAAIMLWPFIPSTAGEVLRRLGQEDVTATYNNPEKLAQLLAWGSGKPATVTVGAPLFMRLT